MQHRIVVGILCAVVCACGDTAGPQAGDGEITIRTDRSEYDRNQQIIVRTTNLSGRLVYDDHCGGRVEGYELEGEWGVSFGLIRACLELNPVHWRESSIPIPHGTVHVDSFYINNMAYTGSWRVQLFLRDDNGVVLPEGRRVSNTFRVNGTWSP